MFLIYLSSTGEFCVCRQALLQKLHRTQKPLCGGVTQHISAAVFREVGTDVFFVGVVFFFLRIANTRCRFSRQCKITPNEQMPVVICPSFVSHFLSHVSLPLGFPFVTPLDGFIIIPTLRFARS